MTKYDKVNLELGNRELEFEMHNEDTIYFSGESYYCDEIDTYSTPSITMKELCTFLNDKKEYDNELKIRIKKECRSEFAIQLKANSTRIKNLEKNLSERKTKIAKIAKLTEENITLKKSIKLVK